MSRTDVTTFATAVYDALGQGASALVAVARGWDALEKSYGARPIYGFRPVLNAEEIREHYVAHGVPESAVMPDDDMHVTVVWSKRAFFRDWDCFCYPNWTVIVRGGNRFTRVLQGGSGKRALVLTLDSAELVSEWNFFRTMGASWEFDSYVPHVSVGYDYEGPEDVPPFTGDVVLGEIEFRDLNDKEESVRKFSPLRDDAGRGILTSVEILRADDDKRVVWGWVSVATEKGEKVFDSHGDHIPMSELENASIEFMLKHRVGKAMHEGGKVSDVIGCVPLSKELSSALGIECDREGLIMGFRVNDDEVWESVKKGDFPAFSIGGRGVRVPL